MIRIAFPPQPEETVALRDKTVRELLGRDRQFGAPTLEFGQHIRNGGLEIAPPSRHIRPGYRFRCKIGIVAPLFGQRPMHFGGAQSELARERQKENIGVGQIGVSFAARHQRVVEVSSEIVQGLRPTVSLVLDKAEQHAKGVSLRFLVAVEVDFHERQKRRRIAETGAFNKETRHLDLGMRTGLQTPVSL